jgi:hypothetical protein
MSSTSYLRSFIECRSISGNAVLLCAHPHLASFSCSLLPPSPLAGILSLSLSFAAVADVPQELHRHFMGLRELDEKNLGLEKLVEEDCMQQLREVAERQRESVASPSKRQRVGSAAAAAAAAPQNAQLSQRVEHNLNEIMKLSEEKVRLFALFRFKLFARKKTLTYPCCPLLPCLFAASTGPANLRLHRPTHPQA